MASDVRYIHIPDGLEAAHTDQNASRDYQRALFGDMHLGSLFQRVSPYDFQIPYPHRATVLANGLSAAPVPAGTNLRIDNAAGLIHQYTALTEPDGATPVMLSYWVEADELQSTLAAGHATLPRIDLIEIKLDVEDESESRDFMDANGIVSTSSGVVRKRVRLTRSVTTGTPHATPSAPVVTSGYAAYCYIWVPATHATAFTDLHVWDLRYPLGFDRLVVPAASMTPQAGGDWPLTAGGACPRAAAIGDNMLAFLPTMDPGKRLLKVYVQADANVDLRLYTISDTGTVTTIVEQQTGTKYLTIPVGTAANSAVLPGAVWCNGMAHGDPYGFGNVAVKQLVLQISAPAGGESVYSAHFEIAGTV